MENFSLNKKVTIEHPFFNRVNVLKIKLFTHADTTTTVSTTTVFTTTTGSTNGSTTGSTAGENLGNKVKNCKAPVFNRVV